jgi:hypothetical protein
VISDANKMAESEKDAENTEKKSKSFCVPPFELGITAKREPQIHATLLLIVRASYLSQALVLLVLRSAAEFYFADSKESHVTMSICPTLQRVLSPSGKVQGVQTRI